MAAFILPVYIVLLLVGGLMGYLKAGSKVSLIMSATFAVLLALAGFTGLTYGPQIVLGLLVALLVVFGARLYKTRKFMPAGLMVGLTVLALILHLVALRGTTSP